jgi:hypothetical protein
MFVLLLSMPIRIWALRGDFGLCFDRLSDPGEFTILDFGIWIDDWGEGRHKQDAYATLALRSSNN